MINKEKLEELLVRNWAKFFDTKKLVAKVLQDVAISFNTFNIAERGGPERNSMQVSLSRFYLADSGFILWVEFIVPRDAETSVGTAEYILSNNGSLELRQIMGTRFTIESK